MHTLVSCLFFSLPVILQSSKQLYIQHGQNKLQPCSLFYQMFSVVLLPSAADSFKIILAVHDRFFIDRSAKFWSFETRAIPIHIFVTTYFDMDHIIPPTS